VIRANDRGQVSQAAVAHHMARLNYRVHREISEKSVGHRCIVAWRNRKGGVHKGGGTNLFYTNETVDHSSGGLPIIAGGMDIRAFLNVLMPRWKPGEPVPQEINLDLARLPDKPDENLR
jgi:hypothetical protein